MERRDRETTDSRPGRGRALRASAAVSPTGLVLALVLVLNVILRLRFVGHVLGVDEANNYLAVTTMTGATPGRPSTSSSSITRPST